MASSTRPSMLSADKVIAPAEAIANALKEKRRMIEIERTDPQSVRCSRSEPAQGNLLHKGASQNGAVSACVMHGGRGQGRPPKPLLPEQARDLLETDHGASQLRCCIVL